MQWPWWFGWVGLLVGVDQLVGWLVRHARPGVVVSNHAALFGLLQGPAAIGGLIGVAAVVLWQQRDVVGRQRWLAVALALIVAGGLSNIIDRVVLGGVIDYLPIPGWFTFNLADTEISLGTLIFLWQEVSRRRS